MFKQDCSESKLNYHLLDNEILLVAIATLKAAMNADLSVCLSVFDVVAMFR